MGHLGNIPSSDKSECQMGHILDLHDFLCMYGIATMCIRVDTVNTGERCGFEQFTTAVFLMLSPIFRTIHHRWNDTDNIA